MDIAQNILDHVHTFNSVCAVSASQVEGYTLDGFGVDLTIAHHGGVEMVDGDHDTQEHYEGGVAVLRMTRSQALKVHEQLCKILFDGEVSA